MERRRFWAILVLFIASALFWSAFEQAGSTLNLFAERNTNLHAWDRPLWGLFRASYFQSFNSIFIIALAPVFAWLWVKLSTQRAFEHREILLGLVFVGLGFAILIPVAGGTNVSPWWLTADLSAAHHRRTLPEPGRTERDDETRARAHRRAHDGRLVSLHLGGRLHRRTARFRV